MDKELTRFKGIILSDNIDNLSADDEMTLSKSMLRVLDHESQIALMTTYALYQVDKGSTVQEATERCCDILSHMVENGQSTIATIQEFRSSMQRTNLDRFVAFDSDGVRLNPQSEISLRSILGTVAMESAAAEFAPGESEAIERFMSAANEYRNATDALCAMLAPSLQKQIGNCLSTYKEFDDEFVKSMTE